MQPLHKLLRFFLVIFRDLAKIPGHPRRFHVFLQLLHLRHCCSHIALHWRYVIARNNFDCTAAAPLNYTAEKSYRGFASARRKNDSI